MMHVIRGGGGASAFISKYRNTNASAYSGIINAGSSIKRREKSYAAASVLSEPPKPKQRRKTVSRAERRVIVETCVNKYREANNGIFPRVGDILKEVGGGRYATRRILQELEYKSEMSTSNEKKDSLSRKGHTKESESFTKVDDLVTKKVKKEKHVFAQDKNTLSKEDEKVEEAQGRHAEFVETENNLPSEAEEASVKPLEKPEVKTNTRVHEFHSELSQPEKTPRLRESGKFNDPMSEDADRAKTVEKVSEECEKEEQMVSEGSAEHKSIELSNKEETNPTVWGGICYKTLQEGGLAARQVMEKT